MAQSLSADILVLADYATISKENKLSIIGIFDQFFVKNTPTNWPKMYLVAVLSGQPNKEYDVKLRAEFAKTEMKFPDRDLKIQMGASAKANMITELINFPLPAAGIHSIILSSEGKELASIKYRVTKTANDFSSDLTGKRIVN